MLILVSPSDAWRSEESARVNAGKYCYSGTSLKGYVSITYHTSERRTYT